MNVWLLGRSARDTPVGRWPFMMENFAEGAFLVDKRCETSWKRRVVARCMQVLAANTDDEDGTCRSHCGVPLTDLGKISTNRQYSISSLKKVHESLR